MPRARTPTRSACWSFPATRPRPTRASVRWRTRSEAPAPQLPKEERPAPGDGLQLIRYRPLFSGPAVERIPELQFQRPEPEVELSRLDAEARGIAAGETVSVSHNGTSLALHA